MTGIILIFFYLGQHGDNGHEPGAKKVRFYWLGFGFLVLVFWQLRAASSKSIENASLIHSLDQSPTRPIHLLDCSIIYLQFHSTCHSAIYSQAQYVFPSFSPTLHIQPSDSSVFDIPKTPRSSLRKVLALLDGLTANSGNDADGGLRTHCSASTATPRNGVGPSATNSATSSRAASRRQLENGCVSSTSFSSATPVGETNPRVSSTLPSFGLRVSPTAASLRHSEFLYRKIFLPGESRNYELLSFQFYFQDAIMSFFVHDGI